MQEGQPVRVTLGLQGGFVHQAADGKMGQKEAEELLSDARKDPAGPTRKDFRRATV